MSLNSGVTASLSSLPNNLIAFDGKGIPYTDASASTALAATATLTLTFNNQTRSVAVARETGSVSVQ